MERNRTNHEVLNRVVMQTYDKQFWAMLYSPANGSGRQSIVRLAHEMDYLLREIFKP